MKRREEKQTQEFIVVQQPKPTSTPQEIPLEPFSLLNSFTLARVKANYKLNPKLHEIFFPSKRFHKHLLITGLSNLSKLSLLQDKNFLTEKLQLEKL